MYYYDFRRYSNSAFVLRKNQTEENLKARITMNYHSLEKGLSNSNIRFNFGQRALRELFKYLEQYIEAGYSFDDIRFKTGLSVIEQYIELHNKHNIDVSSIKERYNKLISVSSKEDYGGVKEFTKDFILSKRKSNFAELSFYRSSVRDFSNEPVDIQLINEAIQIATKTPSVCNRQPWSVYVIKKRDLKERILRIQSGLTEERQKQVDTLIAITSKNSFLATPEERNQGFVDGGMFSMSLLYALQYVGLATCALNADLSKKDDKKIRDELGIPDSENLILFIAVGHYPDKFKVPKSQRDSYKEITKYYL